MRIIIDANSVLNAAILGGKDEEFGRVIVDEAGRKHQVNSAIYGVDKFFDHIDGVLTEFDAAPRDIVLVWDGSNAKSRRHRIFDGYKAGRDKLQEVSDQLNLARATVTQSMLDLGAHVCTQKGYEADDVIGYLCKTIKNEKNLVVTSDGDLTVLHDENTSIWRLGKINENPYGPFPHKFITLYKALVGDSGDKIPGAKGFGDAAWCDMVRIFGLENLQEIENLIVSKKLDELKDNIVDLKAFAKVVDGKDGVYMSWALAKLYWDEINTMERPLEIRAGMVKQWGETVDQAPTLRRFYGTKTLVTAANYQAVRERVARIMDESPFVALDIETSSSVESDEWMEQVKQATESDRERIDVLGHELTGMSLTFGANTQHTIYMAVDHKDTDNITVDQCREMVEIIPQSKHTIIQNRQFEFSVLYRTWGEKWKDNGWFGFVPNALDTKVGASYVDENLKKGLKDRSKHHLGYEQATYQQTTQRSGPVGTYTGGQILKTFKHEVTPAVFETIDVEEEWIDDDGEIHLAKVQQITKKVLVPAVTEDWETREYKMNQLTGAEVLDYGCDDTLCTAALHTHFKFIMDLEGTWQTYLDVETLPEYLTTLAFVQGIRIDLAKLKDLEGKDDESYKKAWETLRAYLMLNGWEGTYCPEFADSIDPADAKMAVDILLEGEFTTKKRKLNAIALDIRTQFPDNALANTLAQIVEEGDVPSLNRLIRQYFTGEPKINFGSPKQMQDLFYRTLGITPRIINKMTDKQREDPVMAEAFAKLRAAKRDKRDIFSAKYPEDDKPKDYAWTKEELVKLRKAREVALSPDERKALISKASTDDTAVDTALALDVGLTDDVKAVLKAYKTIKEVQTRRNLFYKTYKAIPHWRDGRIHPSLNQSEAVTRRYSSSGPNVQQLPSKGEGAHFREVLLPHHRDAVVVSLDFSGQELRLGAELSGDPAMTSCYVGDNLRDMHSLTAVAAAATMWGSPVSYDDFQKMRKSPDPAIAAKAKKLRDDAKTVNFASQYGAMAAKIAETMMCDEETAQTFLDARAEAFPGIIRWDKAVQEEAKKCGFSRTMLGARRHLREALDSDNHWDRSKAERQVGNFWIQSSAAEMTKLAMARVWASRICTGKYDSEFLAPIHDELCFSVHKDQAVDFIKEAHACMVAPYADMKIPLESSIAIGRNFAADYEVGSLPDKAAIQKVLDEMFQ